eukprot:143652-Alexandrium_andersonii.AAC.1
MLRRPSQSYLEGVRFSQRRAIRIMHNHFHRMQDRSSSSADVEDNIPDFILQRRLQAYEQAVDPDKVPDDGEPSPTATVPGTEVLDAPRAVEEHRRFRTRAVRHFSLNNLSRAMLKQHHVSYACFAKCGVANVAKSAYSVGSPP